MSTNAKCRVRARPLGVSTTPRACALLRLLLSSGNLATKTRWVGKRRSNYLDFGMWTRLLSDVETFIEAVKVRPALYDSKHENYSRKDIRTRLWDEIGKVMYPEWDSFNLSEKNEKGSLLQRKWKSLKDCFNREVRLQKLQTTNKGRKKYEYYDRMSFLLANQSSKPTKPAETEKEVTIKDEVLEGLETDARTPNTSLHNSWLTVSIPNRSEISSPEKNLRKRKPEMEGEFSERWKQKKKSKEEEDSDRLFLISFLNDFNKLPLATKYWVKMKFSEIMHQAVMSLEEYQDAECGHTSGDYEQEVGSSAVDYPIEDLQGKTSPVSSSSSEIYEFRQQ